MNKLLQAFTRTKHLTLKDLQETKLRRCLSTLDLTLLGIGCTLGAGVYVVTGEVARLQAGPAIVLSFTIAAIASILSGLCYAEFGARVPKAGSAYIYSYVTIGELCAFVIGWNLVLEYIVGASSVARAWSAFFDSLSDNRIRNFTLSHVGKINVPWMSEYPDFLAFAFIIVITLILISGAKQSSFLNWVFTSINLSVILFVTVGDLVFAEAKNWDNFMPYGFGGVMTGAATCFYAFVGFDAVATCGEECNTPSKSIPRAIIGSLSICFLAYAGVSIALTLMIPYHDLAPNTALATAFEHKGLTFGKYVVSVGAIFGLSSSALGGLFPLPRILYAMGSDGVIFSFFTRVNERTGTPIISCIFSGLITGILALILDLVSLVEMLSIGTLLAYTIVSLCVLLLRYKPGSLRITAAGVDSRRASMTSNSDTENIDAQKDRSGTAEGRDSRVDSVNVDGEMNTGISGEQSTKIETEELDNCTTSDKLPLLHDSKESPPTNPTDTWVSKFSRHLLGERLDEPTEETYCVVKVAVALFVVLCIALEGCIIWGEHGLTSKDPFMIILFVFLLVSLLLVVEVIGRQPQSKNELPFKAPLLPVTPLLAIFVNMYLILMLSHLTWIRFGVWMTIGKNYVFTDMIKLYLYSSLVSMPSSANAFRK